MTRYVQHISGRGEKWRVITETDQRFFVRQHHDSTTFDLPKSEYRRVDPPEQWVDVTARLVERKDGPFQSRFDDPGVHGCAVYTLEHSPYRLRKVELCRHGAYLHALIVERKDTR